MVVKNKESEAESEQHLCITWETIGPGGGGRCYGLGISPHNLSLLLSGSDMGGVYRTNDAGLTWAFLNGRMLARVNTFDGKSPWAFHPIHENIIFVGSVKFGFLKSKDAGLTWDKVEIDCEIDKTRGPELVAFNRQNPWYAAACWSERNGKQSVVLLSCNGGESWENTSGIISNAGKVKGIVLTGKENLVITAAFENGIYVSHDCGNTWIDRTDGLPTITDNIIHFAGGANDKQSVFYVTLKSVVSEEETTVGVFRSVNNGKWERVTGDGLYVKINEGFIPQYKMLAVCYDQPNCVYVTFHGAHNYYEGDGISTVYKSMDAGETWESVLFQHPENPNFNVEKKWHSGKWGWHYPPSSLVVSDSNPNYLFYSTFTSAAVTSDGGKIWREIGSGEFDDDATIGGMQIMTSWNYYIDPHESNRHYVAMTDFSGWRSMDEGKSWIHSWKGNPWRSNVYAIAFDPDIPGKIWGAAAVTHDLPYWHYLVRYGDQWGGGVITSNDFGETWVITDQNETIPFATAMDIYLDPQSTAENRRLYTALLGRGIYKTENGGSSWKNVSRGLPYGNLSTIRIGKDDHGRLLTLITAKWTNNEIIEGGLYFSHDKGETWNNIPFDSEMVFPVNYHVSKENKDIIYVSCYKTWDEMTVVPETKCGKHGLWKTTDGGQTWKRLLDDPTYYAICHPDDPNILFATVREFGVYLSSDAGESWTLLNDLPIFNPHTIHFDDNDHSTIYVTSFGQGVWKGSINFNGRENR